MTEPENTTIDVAELFRRVAAASAEQAPSSDIVDGDVARGHRALARVHHRQVVRRSLVTTVTLVVVAVAVTAGVQHGGSAAQPRSSRPAAAVRLVSYTGSQPAGFTVDRIPDGWHLSGSTPSALTIDPAGDTDNDPDVFEGKLTVLLQSQDVHGLPAGTAVEVDGEPGVVTAPDRYGEILTYDDTSHHILVIQAPRALAWSDAQIVQFAEGVHVTADAVAGRG
jgi:hypothetical protein